MLSEVKKRFEGPKFNIDFDIDFGGKGFWGRQGKGIGISTMQKGAILRKCVNTFVPHCSLIGRRRGWGEGGISFRLLALSKCPGHRRGRGRRGGEQRTGDFPPKKQVANTISHLKQT